MTGPSPEILTTPRLSRMGTQTPLALAGVVGEDGMHDMIKRHQVQVLRAAGHTLDDVAKLSQLSISSVQRIEEEPSVTSFDDLKTVRKERKVGRPSKVEAFRELIVGLCLEEDADHRPLQSKEIVRRLKQKGYQGSKTAACAFIASLRPRIVRALVRFEGLPGEFCQHDFGHTDVVFTSGLRKRIHFFASRLKWSRSGRVTIVENERVETVIRTQLQHYVDFGGRPLFGVWDRPRTIAHKWTADGVITEWNQTFINAQFEIGVGAEVCWPYRPNQKGAVENLVGWVKNSFFKQRTFIDEQDLHEQLEEWLVEVNTKTPSRATDVIPETRRLEELARLQAPKVLPHELALRMPVFVGPTAYAPFDGNYFMLPAAAMGIGGTVFIYNDRLRFVVGRHQVAYPRPAPGVKDQKLDLPHLQAEMVAAVSGRRAKLYLKRQQLLEVGEPAHRFLTELVHRRPMTWPKDAECLHALLLDYGKSAMFVAFGRAVADATIGVEYVAHYLRSVGRPAAAQAEAGRSDTNLSVAPDSAPALVVNVKAGRPADGA